MVFNNKGIEVKVEFEIGRTNTDARNKLIKDVLSFFEECKKEHNGLRCTLSVILRY